jgi:hypothetical protein
MSSLVERLAQNAENKGSSGYGYFKLDIGSSAVLRFLSPMVDNVVVNHASVGCSCNIEIPQDMWNRTKEQTGQNPVCPICQRPFADTDVITVKEGVRGGGFHYIPNGGYVLCLDDIDNNQPYACPLCQTQVEKTKRDGTKYMGANVPQDRMCAYAVIRKVNRERGTDGRGMPVEQIVSIEDEMVERNGAMVPNVVIVDQAYSNFWAQLTSKDDDFCDPITYYDYEVYRSDMRTYVVTKIQRPAEVVDIERYRPYMTRTLAEHVSFKGTPQYYTSKGIYVPGFTSEDGAVPGYAPSTLAGAAQSTLAAAAQPAAAYGAPVQPGYAAPTQQFAQAPASVPMQPPMAPQGVQSAPAAPVASQPAPMPSQQQYAPQTAPQQPAAAPAQSAYMPQPVGSQPMQPQPVQPAPQPAQAAPQQPAATVPWTDAAGSVGASVYDEDILF